MRRFKIGAIQLYRYTFVDPTKQGIFMATNRDGLKLRRRRYYLEKSFKLRTFFE